MNGVVPPGINDLLNPASWLPMAVIQGTLDATGSISNIKLSHKLSWPNYTYNSLLERYIYWQVLTCGIRNITDVVDHCNILLLYKSGKRSGCVGGWNFPSVTKVK